MKQTILQRLQELSYRKETVRLQRAVPTSEKFIVHLSALHCRPDGSLSANISGRRGQFVSYSLRDVDRQLFHFVTIHTSDV